MANEFDIKQIVAGYCFSYILDSDRQAVIIDPHITKVQVYRDYLASKGLTLVAVVDTHTHADHLSSTAILAGEYKCPIIMSANAVSAMDIQRVTSGSVVRFGSAALTVLPAPGHTDDSIALVGGGCVFTGDVLLINSVGRTDFQNGSPEEMFDTLAQLKALPDETVVYPAHDYKGNRQSTIGQEKATNPFMLQTGREAFAANARAKVLAKPFNMDAIIQTNREGSAREIETISPAAARDRLEAEGSQWQVLDVRRPEEYRAVRIAQSINIPLNTLAARLGEVTDSGKRYILSCQSGARAMMAASIFLAAGVNDVIVMDGAITAWQKAHLPVLKEKVPVSLERQVRTIAGLLVLAGCLLALFVNLWFLAIPLLVACGLIFAGVTNSCMMGMLLMKLPYNRKAISGTPPAGGSCSLDGGSCAADAPASPGGSCSLDGGSCAADSPSDSGGCSM